MLLTAGHPKLVPEALYGLSEEWGMTWQRIKIEVHERNRASAWGQRTGKEYRGGVWSSGRSFAAELTGVPAQCLVLAEYEVS